MIQPGDLPECFIEQLLEVVEALIDEKLCSDHGRDSLIECLRRSDLQQELINVWSFGEKPDDL